MAQFGQMPTVGPVNPRPRSATLPTRHTRQRTRIVTVAAAVAAVLAAIALTLALTAGTAAAQGPDAGPKTLGEKTAARAELGAKAKAARDAAPRNPKAATAGKSETTKARPARPSDDNAAATTTNPTTATGAGAGTSTAAPAPKAPAATAPATDAPAGRGGTAAPRATSSVIADIFENLGTSRRVSSAGTRTRPAIGDCNPDQTTPIDHMVADIFRCRLSLAGRSPAEIRTVVAEAVTVAKCESNFDTRAVVFDGKYLHQAHPRTGYRYSAAGVFQFIRATADTWITGGYTNVHDPVANIDAAARLYLHNSDRGLRGWEDWACVAVNDGFAHRSVLPGWPGGPDALPAWAYTL